VEGVLGRGHERGSLHFLQHADNAGKRRPEMRLLVPAFWWAVENKYRMNRQNNVVYLGFAQFGFTLLR